MGILLFLSSFSPLSNIWIGCTSKVKSLFISSGTCGNTWMGSISAFRSNIHEIHHVYLTSVVVRPIYMQLGLSFGLSQKDQFSFHPKPHNTLPRCSFSEHLILYLKLKGPSSFICIVFSFILSCFHFIIYDFHLLHGNLYQFRVNELHIIYFFLIDWSSTPSS